MNPSVYDIIMAIVLVGAALYGWMRGMAWQIASLASIFLSAAAAAHFSPSVAGYFSAQEPWNRYLAMLVIYLATSFAIWMIFRMISKIIDRVKLQEFDHQTGALFGVAKGALLCIVITFFAVTLSESSRQVVLQSHSGNVMTRITKNAAPILPPDVRDYLGRYLDEFERKLDPNTPPDGSGSLLSKKIFSTSIPADADDSLKDLSEDLDKKWLETKEKLEAMGNKESGR